MLFIKKAAIGFAIIAVYVDGLNLIGTLEELIKTIDYLKKEFEMKDLEKTINPSINIYRKSLEALSYG